MIDYGLLASVVLALGAPSILAKRWPMQGFERSIGFVDATFAALFAGLVVGRLTTLLIDDPRSLRSLPDIMVIRTGVEFWPGTAAAACTVAWSAHRQRVSATVRLAGLAPLAMIGYATYEAGCVLRSGCFGPVTTIGLRPAGVGVTMVPVGLLMAIATAGIAWLLHTVRRRLSPGMVVTAATAAVAATRAIGSVWLPKVGDGLTRQHRASIAVAVISAALLAALSARRATTVRRVPVP